MDPVPGAASLVLVRGVSYLDEAAAVFEAMVEGWSRQQASRRLQPSTISARLNLIRRFQRFTEEYPWLWRAQDVEDFTVSLMSRNRLSTSTIRGYHLTLRQFCDYLTDRRYDWMTECERRFSSVPTQVCHEWNTVVHLDEYEGRPARRPLTYDELETLFGHCDDRVEQIARTGRKGALAAMRDAQILKTTYAFGLRRREVARLDIADLRVNPQVREWGQYGSLHVRYGKAVRGGPPRRRTVLAVPEFDWALDGLRQWVEEARPRMDPRAHPAVWITERNSRVSVRYLDIRFAELRAGAGLPAELTLHCLRHSYVTHLIEFGYAERFVQEQVGHATASSTVIYASVGSDFKNRILADALHRVYDPAKGRR
ncbi:tyrosine-type recombinase/integrase [Microbacterium sp. H1-D42]|uniref:tyrosine-type recombinase/integrase n=1 Tax=Microbacterium sp. H1-D42 TaxID=2925844 RepID=UPI001F53A25A|nr:tyrosine-type recombinase/integrase [Microbacterium sp. H1-D42]UNK69900.1 tyrosine-type recombinase/integrase [Microbacterium sp. H1-D42]